MTTNKTKKPPLVVAPQQTISIPITKIQEGLAGLSTVNMRHAPLPVLIESYHGRIRLTTSDYDSWVTYEAVPRDKVLPGSSLATRLQDWRHGRTNGAIMVPLDRLDNALKIARGELLHIGVAQNTTTMRYPVGRSESTERFPTIHTPFHVPTLEGETSRLTITPTVLGVMKMCFKFASKDQYRAVLNGILFDSENPARHFLVATDGRRLVRSQPFQFEGLRHQFTVPTNKTINFIVRSGRSWHLTVSKVSKQMEQQHGRFEAGPWTIVSRLVQGNYPKWRQIVPRFTKGPEFTMHFGLGGAALATNVLKHLPMGLNASKDSCGVLVRADGNGGGTFERGGVAVSIEHCEVKGFGSILLSGKYLAEALDNDFRRLEVQDKLSVAQFFDTSGSYHLLMPMKEEPVKPPMPYHKPPGAEEGDASASASAAHPLPRRDSVLPKVESPAPPRPSAPLPAAGADPEAS